MIRKTAIAASLAAVLVPPALAASPLPPGRPAGSQNAQLTGQQTIFVGVGVLTLGLGLYLASGEYKIQGDDGSTPPPATPPTTTPSTTTQ